MSPVPQSPHPPGTVTGPEEIRKDALRIQAAAVAAQQAALTEEEARLEQRREALEQQQEQLAARLEKQRQQLLQLHEEAKAARLAQHKERAAFDSSVARTRADLEKAQHEILTARDEAVQERRRLIDLRRRLKQRWHRHWTVQRKILETQGQELARQRQRLDRKQQELEQQRTTLDQERRRATGDLELGKRQLQDAWNHLRQEQEAWTVQRRRDQTDHDRRIQELGQREAAVAQAQRDLAGDQQRWQETRLRLEREIEGLETRAVNLRRKLQELQGPLKSPTAAAQEPFVPVRSDAGPTELQQERDHLLKLAEDLADQRSQLVEQWQRLARTQQRWEHDRDAAAAELQALAARLPQREQALVAQEQRQQLLSGELQRQQWELLQKQHHLEAGQIRLRASEAAWRAQRDRVLADAQSRQDLANRLEVSLVELRGRWAKRRKLELEQLHAEQTAVAKLRQEWLARNEECWQRVAQLEEQQRRLKNREVALEAGRQQLLTGSPDAAAAERALERLERQWARQHAATLRALEDERQRLHVQAQGLQTQLMELPRQKETLQKQEAGLAERQAALEMQEVQRRGKEMRIQEHSQKLQAERDRVLKHNAELQEDLERLALLLMQEPVENLPRIGQAA